ncbi:porin [Duganella sp. FT3S]|uniref:Porin n=1 Tax=Rugamonas fusca TaxID=2758568 RepID=A0A7W2EI92_9BURK|nr:porin [Rugamonas fusca]MBA5606427.1 porin [Rugamonas fusca]
MKMYLRMKRKGLYATGLAVMAGHVMAQSDVRLYGALDAGLLNITNTSGGTGYLPGKVNAGTLRALKDGGISTSNWGLSGNETLGGQLKALFQLQGNVNLANGSGGGPNSNSATSLFNQMAVIGLSGDFGTIKLGRQASPTYFAMASTDARGARYFGSALNGLVALNSASKAFIGNNSNVAFGTIYNDNALVYTSPTIGDVTFNVGYAAGESGGSVRANSQQSLTAVYRANDWTLSALYYNGYGNDVPVATALYGKALGDKAPAAVAAAGLVPTANTNRLVSLGALYRWNAYKVSGALYRATNPAHAVLPGGAASLGMWTLGAGWDISPAVNLTTGYYRITDHTNVGNQASQSAVGLDVLLSKRTLLYLVGARVRNQGANMNFSPVYATAVAANSNARAVMAGTRHTF